MFDFMLAPFVMARRVEKVVTPSGLHARAANDQQKAVEVNRMVVEKMAAMHLGMLAGSAQMLRSTTLVTGHMLRGDALGAAMAVADSPRKMVAASLKPARSILRANVRRLSRD